MALSSQLTKFKAPGTKILLDVVNQIPQVEMPSGARVLIISSRKGEVNKLVPVANSTDYFRRFDNISDADERRGNWSARSAQFMLAVGPIYVLNLRSFDDDQDLAGLQELSMVADVANATGKEIPYTSLYNTQQFWKIEPQQLIKQENQDQLLVFGNVGNQNLSVFVRKSRVAADKTLTFDQWYKNLNREIPGYVNPFDKVSDWIVDVMIFENKFGIESQSNANYGFCFNADGSVKKEVVSATNQTIDGLTQLSRITESGFIRTITGSLIQGFDDEKGQNFDIVSQLNQLVQLYGLVAKRNEAIFDDVAIWVEGDTNNNDGKKRPIPFDFAGHTLCHITEIGSFDKDAFLAVDSVKAASYDFLSDSQDLPLSQSIIDSNDSPVVGDTHLLSHTALLPGNVLNGNVNITNKNELYLIGGLKVNIGEKYVAVDGNLATVTGNTFVGSMNKVYGAGTVNAPIQPYGDDVNFPESHDWEASNGADDTFTYIGAGTLFPKDGTNSFYIYPADHVLAGEPLVFDALTGFVVHNPREADVANYIFQLDGNEDFLTPDWANLPVGYAPTNVAQLIELTDIEVLRIQADDVANTTTKYQDLITVVGVKENVYRVTFDKHVALNNSQGQNVAIDLASRPVTTNDYIMLDNGSQLPVYSNELVAFRIRTFEQKSDKFQPINLKAYTPRVAQFLNGTSERQNEVLNVLLNTGLKNALANKDIAKWNYVVDGFKSYIEPNSKYQLKEIAKARKLGRAICNLPSIHDFIYSSDPYFKDAPNGQFHPKFIVEGGNKELPHSNSFSLPSESGFYAYFFGPNLELSNGKTMPAAALASNAFARKYLNNKPYVIVAGPDNGIIAGQGVVGVEWVFNEGTEEEKGDRDYLNPFGYNVIVNKSTGLQIYGNRTAQNTVETPVSSIHTSEVVMYIQERINKLLERYVFKYNISRNRLVIKEEADDICAEPRADGAISDFVNVMDTTNNTQEVIDNRLGILDTILYGANGMEIAIHRTKIDTLSNTASFEIL